MMGIIRFTRPLALIIAAAMITLGLSTFSLTRDEVDDKYKWDLTDLYPSEEAWTAAKDDIAEKLPSLMAYKGRLGESAATFYEAVDTMSGVAKDFARLFSYVSQLSDQDTRDSKAMEMQMSLMEVARDFQTSMSWIEPEVLSMDVATIEGFIDQEPGLKIYKPYLDNILRMKPHTLDEAGEKLVAQASKMSGSAAEIYGIFTNAEMPYPEVTLDSGETVTMDAANYTKYRGSISRGERERVFKAFWERYNEFRRTLGTSLYANIQSHIFRKEARNYDSCLEAALKGDNIPVEVYKQLISDVHANLPTLHRYLKLRQKMMGVEQLRYDDLYAPIIEAVDMSFTPEEAMDLTLKAFAPLGKEYVDTLAKGYQSRWVDFYATEGKRSGAYSNGAAYDVHPYQLLNFMGGYEDVSTLAHESGHSMHSYLSNANQPYVTADYSIFVAEVASTFDEHLLMDYMLDHTKDDATRLFLLGQWLDGFRQTLFRQTLFAEFEWKTHEMAEKGMPLSGDSLNNFYLSLLKKYYGHDEGFCHIDDLYAVEWAYIPHFYYNFYVWQYATSMVASTSFYNMVMKEADQEKTARRDAYVKMLSSGSSKYPVDLLKDAGVDMTTSVPFNAAMDHMNWVMDEIEKILAKKKAA